MSDLAVPCIEIVKGCALPQILFATTIHSKSIWDKRAPVSALYLLFDITAINALATGILLVLVEVYFEFESVVWLSWIQPPKT